MTENLKTSFKWTYVRYFGSLFCYNRYTLTFSPKEYIYFDMQSRSSFVRHISGKVTFPLLDKFNDTLLSLSLEVHVYMRFLNSANNIIKFVALDPILSHGKNLFHLKINYFYRFI